MGLARQLVGRLVELEQVQFRLLAEYFTGCAGRECPSKLAELVLQLCSRHLADGARGNPQRPVSRGRRAISRGAQARRRLYFVRPGEVAYVIVDPAASGLDGSGESSAEGPWVSRLWSNLQAADNPRAS